MVKYQNITEIQIVKDQTQSHLMSMLNQFCSEVQERCRTVIAHYKTTVLVLSSIKQQGRSHSDGPENTPTSVTQSTESPHPQPWYKNGSDDRGTGIPEPCPDCQAWHQQTRGPPVWCSGILAHIIHILSKLNKQQVPHAESHISPLNIIATFNFACSLSSPCPSSPHWKTIWKRSGSSCWIQVWYAAYTKPEWTSQI